MFVCPVLNTWSESNEYCSCLGSMLKNTFLDYTDGLNVGRHSRWKSCTYRRVLHYASTHIELTKMAAPEGDKEYYHQDEFTRVLADQMDKHRRKAGDTSASILWKVDPVRMIRWVGFSPKIYKLEPSIPSIVVPKMESTPWAKTDTPYLVRDSFFRNIHINTIPHTAQLNHIIVGRAIEYIQSRHPKRLLNQKIKNGYTEHWRKVRLEGDTGLSFMHESRQHLVKFGMEVHKSTQGSNMHNHPGLVEAILSNKDHWIIHNDSVFDLFEYSKENTALMKNAIDTNDSMQVLTLAQKGVITKQFIRKLKAWKEEYDGWRQTPGGNAGKQKLLNLVHGV